MDQTQFEEVVGALGGTTILAALLAFGASPWVASRYRRGVHRLMGRPSDQGVTVPDIPSTSAVAGVAAPAPLRIEVLDGDSLGPPGLSPESRVGLERVARARHRGAAVQFLAGRSTPRL